MIWPKMGRNQSSGISGQTGLARYRFSLKETQDVQIYVRGLGPSNFNNSIWFQLEGADNTFHVLETPNQEYFWHLARGYQRLEPGDYTLILKKRENGTLIDQIFLTTEGRLP